MGMYDEIKVGGNYGQVKCFGSNLDLFRAGEEVPSLCGKQTYSIAMREGGFVNVADGVLSSWTERPEHPAVFDKYGDEVDPSALDERYVF